MYWLASCLLLDQPWSPTGNHRYIQFHRSLSSRQYCNILVSSHVTSKYPHPSRPITPDHCSVDLLASNSVVKVVSPENGSSYESWNPHDSDRQDKKCAEWVVNGVIRNLPSAHLVSSNTSNEWHLRWNRNVSKQLISMAVESEKVTNSVSSRLWYDLIPQLPIELVDKSRATLDRYSMVLNAAPVDSSMIQTCL